MKIVYVANIRLPTEKAHGVQIMKTCQAFAELGHEVELVVTDRVTPIEGNPFDYYHVQTRFTITRIPVPDTVSLGRLGFWYETFRFAWSAARLLRKKTCDIVYGRDEIVLAYLARRCAFPIVWETHTGAANRSVRALIRRGTRIVAITQGLADFYIGLGASPARMLVAPDGVSVSDFTVTESKEDARSRLGLPHDRRVAMYIGRLDGWKGSETFFEAAKLLDPDVLSVVIGGESHQIKEMSVAYPNIRFLGYRPYAELPVNQSAADVLVLPNTGTNEISTRFTSPLKLFTYMASGIPMVVSDLPSLREIVSEEEAYFAVPDDARSFADTIMRALSDPHAVQRALRAREKVRAYDWRERAQRIVTFFEGA